MLHKADYFNFHILYSNLVHERILKYFVLKTIIYCTFMRSKMLSGHYTRKLNCDIVSPNIDLAKHYLQYNSNDQNIVVKCNS